MDRWNPSRELGVWGSEVNAPALDVLETTEPEDGRSSGSVPYLKKVERNLPPNSHIHSVTVHFPLQIQGPDCVVKNACQFHRERHEQHHFRSSYPFLLLYSPLADLQRVGNLPVYRERLAAETT